MREGGEGGGGGLEFEGSGGVRASRKAVTCVWRRDALRWEDEGVGGGGAIIGLFGRFG